MTTPDTVEFKDGMSSLVAIVVPHYFGRVNASKIFCLPLLPGSCLAGKAALRVSLDNKADVAFSPFLPFDAPIRVSKGFSQKDFHLDYSMVLSDDHRQVWNSCH